jgi:hypothetical protein
MKTTWSRLASLSVIAFTTFTLRADTYYLASLGGADGSPPYPMDPSHGTLPLTDMGDGRYIVDDSGGSLMSSRRMTAASIDPSDPGDEESDGSSMPANVRNYTKYGGQIFSLLNTNDLASGIDTNLYNACAAMPVDTNTTPTLLIQQYGADAVIIRADNFDYSETNADFALLICDNIATPTWKTIDFAGASDAQDGWLVQGTVPNWEVSGTMFMLVTNLNLSYDAFFQAIPYSGPQVAINGVPQPYDVVSNTITLNAQIQDLSGVTNGQFEVTVDDDVARYGFNTTNSTIS